MNLLRATPSLYWPESGGGSLANNIGGVQVQSYRLIRAFSRLDIFQTIYTKLDRSEEITSVDGKVKIAGSKNNFFFPALRWLAGCVRYVNRQYEGGGSFDVLHIQCNGAASPILLGLILNKKWKIPLVYSINCCKQVTYVERFKIEALLRPFMHRLERYSFAQADAVIFSTHAVAAKIRQLNPGVSPEKMYVIGDMIDPAEINLESQSEELEEFRRNYKLPRNTPVILFVGRIAKEKGWRTFIKIASRLRNCGYLFLICGGGPEFGKMQRMIQKEDLHKQVVCTNYISNDQVSYAMSLADLIVIPSQYEEFGSVVLEAGIHALPIVASNIRSFCEILGNGRGNLAEAGDTEGFCKAIRELMEDPKKRAMQANAFLQYVSDNYTVSTVADQYMQIYKKYHRRKR